jgi:hypothetical protein
VAALRARRDSRALSLGRGAVAALYIGAGALVNAVMVVRGDDYAKFADGAYLRIVRDAWHTLVVPSHHWWIGALIGFELTVGVLALMGGRATRLSYGLVIAFHVALMSFGFGFWLWAAPMIVATATLLRAERANAVPRLAGGAPFPHAWAA